MTRNVIAFQLVNTPQMKDNLTVRIVAILALSRAGSPSQTLRRDITIQPYTEIRHHFVKINLIFSKYDHLKK